MFKARVFSAEGKQTGERDLPEALFDGTPHTVLSESRSSPNTPDAPNKRVRKPTKAAVMPDAGL